MSLRSKPLETEKDASNRQRVHDDELLGSTWEWDPEESGEGPAEGGALSVLFSPRKR